MAKKKKDVPVSTEPTQVDVPTEVERGHTGEYVVGDIIRFLRDDVESVFERLKQAAMAGDIDSFNVRIKESVLPRVERLADFAKFVRIATGKMLDHEHDAFDEEDEPSNSPDHAH